MTDLRSDFRNLIALYETLEEKLARIVPSNSSGDPNALVLSILQNRECFERICQMNALVAELSDRWKKCRAHLDKAANDETGRLVEAAKAKIVRMQKMCGIPEEQLQITRDSLEKELAEAGKGAQYLKCLKPAKNNYPKFIDSMQ